MLIVQLRSTKKNFAMRYSTQYSLAGPIVMQIKL